MFKIDLRRNYDLCDGYTGEIKFIPEKDYWKNPEENDKCGVRPYSKIVRNLFVEDGIIIEFPDKVDERYIISEVSDISDDVFYIIK